LWDQPPREPLAAYVNIPFCPSFCPFCGFFKVRHDEELEKRYLASLLREIAREGELLRAHELRISALFIGGGTPALLSPALLGELLEGIARAAPLAADAEITLEGRVSVMDREKAQTIFRGGVNRLSLGIQSFDRGVRARAGRGDSPRKIVSFIDETAALGAGALTLDLMFGLPGQTAEIFARDLETAASLPIDALSAYLTKVMPQTALAREVSDGSALPPLSRLAECYRHADRFLADKGFEKVSANHFRRTQRDRNLYNYLTMGLYDLVGWGAGAGSFTRGKLSLNAQDLGVYADGVERGLKPLAMVRPPHPLAEAMATVSRTLFLGVLGRDLLRREPFDAPLVSELIAVWNEAGLVEEEEKGFKLTQAGFFWRSNLEEGLKGVLSLGLPSARGPAPGAAPTPSRGPMN
jgi:oxygen-independent coproporphyrinogen-3 oxidase